MWWLWSDHAYDDPLTKSWCDGGCEASNGLARWAGTVSCQDLPAELRNLGSDMSLKQGSAIHFLNFSCCPNSANFCVLCLSAFAHAVPPTWKQTLPLLSDTLLIRWPSLYVISCLKFSLVPSGCFNHFLFCASLALCTFLTVLSLFTDSLSRQWSLKARTNPCDFATPPYSPSHPHTFGELKPSLNNMYVLTLLIPPSLAHLAHGVPDMKHPTMHSQLNKIRENRPSSYSGLQ